MLPFYILKDYVVKIANARNNISKHTYTNLTTLGIQLWLILSNDLTMDDDKREFTRIRQSTSWTTCRTRRFDAVALIQDKTKTWQRESLRIPSWHNVKFSVLTLATFLVRFPTPSTQLEIAYKSYNTILPL